VGKSLSKKRKTFGVLINSIDGFYMSPVWKGIKSVAMEQDVNILFFAGDSLAPSWEGTNVQQNVIFDLVNTKGLDGIILASGLLLGFIGLEKFYEFIEPLRKIPLVSISVEVENVPSVIMDGRITMEKLVDHLIEEHNYSKIAFLSGQFTSPEAVMRHMGYMDSLKSHGIVIEDKLFVKGDFSDAAGKAAIDILLERNNELPEAIVCCNDQMAIGALLRLNQLGIKVGKDIAITGFDNIDAVKSLNPAFTTIRQPIFDISAKATNLLIDMIDGKNVPMCTYLSDEVIIRESCGCNKRFSEKISLIDEKTFVEVNYEEECKDIYNKLMEDRPLIVEGIIKELNLKDSSKDRLEASITRIIHVFVEDIKIKNMNGLFLEEINHLFINTEMARFRDFTWNDIIYLLRKYFLKVIKRHDILRLSEEMFYKVRILLGNFLDRRTFLQNFNFKRMYIGTRDIMNKLNAALDVDELKKVVASAMTWYEIEQCYLCLFEAPIKNTEEVPFEFPEYVNLVLACNDKNPKEYGSFRTELMLPGEFIHQSLRNDLIFYPLYYGEDHFGYVAWSMSSIDEFVYETFREQISDTLRIQMLFNERKHAEEQLNLAISELEKLNGELRSKYVIDELTGLFNRRGFHLHGGNLYKAAMITGGKVILFFVDIDGLKSINDSYGHKEGDEAILNVANVLKDSFRSDDVVARMGGDEFIMLAANKFSESDIKDILMRIKTNFEKYNVNAGKAYELSVSIGYSVYLPEVNPTLEVLIQEADKRLYKTKRNKN